MGRIRLDNWIVLVLAVLVLFPSLIVAQYYNVNDERFKYLALKKAEANLHELRQKRENDQELFEKGLISEEVFNKSERNYRLSEIEFQQALLSVMFERPHIMIKSAVKYLKEDGTKRVRLVLVNSSGGSQDMGKLDRLESTEEATSLVDLLDYEKLTNVYVSLKDRGSIVSQPYEMKLEVMEYEKPIVLDFGLLQDLDDIMVSIAYGDRVDEKKIRLTKNSKANPVSMTSIQFSQEANLGGMARYDLALEQYSTKNATYQMMVVNLPKQFAYEYRSVENNTRISQIKFAEGSTSSDLDLVVFLPSRADDAIKIDTPITFYALVLDSKEAARISGGKQGHLSPDEISAIRGGKVNLELTPRGVGKVELMVSQLYYQIDTDDTVACDIAVKNEGTVALYNIAVGLDLPYDWTGEVTPDIIDKLEPGKEKRVSAVCSPSHDMGVGDFEITVKAESFVNNKKIEAQEKTIRIHISSQSSVFGSVAFVGLMVVFVVGVVFFGIKMSRR